MKKTRKIEFEPGKIEGRVLPKSYNEQERTVEIIWTTESPVKRYDWWEGRFYNEVLSLKKAHVKLDRLNSGAALLNNHKSGDLNDVIGTVVDRTAKIEKGDDGQSRGIAVVKLSDAPGDADVVRKIQDGIIRNVSVGYVIHKMEEVKQSKEEKERGDLVTYRAIDWEPMELSFVGIPADRNAKARSHEEIKDKKEVSTVEVEIVNQNQGETMEKENQRSEDTEQVEAPAVDEAAASTEPAEVEEPKQDEPKVDENKEEPEVEASEADEEETTEVVEPEDAEELEAERNLKTEEMILQRQEKIRSICKTMGVEDDFASKLCGKKGITLSEARSEILKELEKRTTNEIKTQNIGVGEVMDQKKRMEALERTVLHRANPFEHKLQEGDQEVMRYSLMDTAREMLRMGGVANAASMSPDEVMQRALHSTSDFTKLLANIANKSLRSGYEGTPNTYEPFVTKRVARDFKEITSIVLGNGGTLQKVNEHGEYKGTTLSETAESYKVETYGLIVGKTRQLMINDDLGGLTEIPARLGVRAREKENEVFWNLFISNQIMKEDGEALFSAAHNNVGTGAISVASIGTGRQAMRLQKDLDGELTSTMPKYLIAPAALETVAEQFLGNINPQQNGQVNPFTNKLQLVIEPRLDAASATQWFLAGDKAMVSIGEMSTLGAGGPQIFTQEGFDVDGARIKIRHEFGMRIVDFRNLYRSSGVA